MEDLINKITQVIKEHYGSDAAVEDLDVSFKVATDVHFQVNTSDPKPKVEKEKGCGTGKRRGPKPGKKRGPKPGKRRGPNVVRRSWRKKPQEEIIPGRGADPTY